MPEIRDSQDPRRRTYISWRDMKRRCGSAAHVAFHHYGGRGITVCTRWLESFDNFIEDMGHRPLGLTLDRIDTNGNYEPNNCRWATRSEQSANTRPRSRKKCQPKGVTRTRSGRYRAYVYVGSRQVHLGTFQTEAEAAAAAKREIA